MIKKLTGASLASAALALAMVGPVGAQNQAGDSLVNVQIVGVRIIRDVDVNAIVGVVAAANVCPNVGDLNLAVLAEQVDAGDNQQTVDCDADAAPDLIIRQNQPRNQ